jgi:phosphatidylinositol-3-phosphatase
MRWLVALVLLAALLVAGCVDGRKDVGLPDDSVTTSARPVGHVFIIVLENEDYAVTFPASGEPPSPYLARNLTTMGRLLTQFYGIGHASLDNYIAMVSGQAPNAVTQADCTIFQEFAGILAPDAPDGQAVGQGCVYPANVLTIADQLEAADHTWRMYGEDMANSPGSAPTTCRHPPVNAQDEWQGATSTDQYATRHIPFLYFHSVIDDQAGCDSHVVDLSLLPADLADADLTPEYVFITPDLCSDGHDAQCADPNQRGEYEGIDDFLRTWIPVLMASPAYLKDGLIIVTFDEAESSSPEACCNEPAGYNTPMPGITGPGGGRTGTVLLAHCIEPGTVDETPYNHYSLLRTTEDLFGVAHLGYAGMDGLVSFALPGCVS